MAEHSFGLASELSRRTTLGRLGGAALALAFAQTNSRASAQEATPAPLLPADHAIVGAWRMTTYPGASDEGTTTVIFAETGSYVDLIWDRNVSLGEWRPIDEKTVELVIFTKWLIPFDAYFVPADQDIEVPDVILTSEMGTARLPAQVGLDDTGDLFFLNGAVWLYDEAGTNVDSFAYWASGARMTVANPTA